MDVINVKKSELKKIGYNSLEEWLENPNHVYIGRNMSFYVSGAKPSKWNNPYSVNDYGREYCLRLYKQYVLLKPELINNISDLEGKVLGCWCKPERCHGDILIELLNEKKRNHTI